MDNDASWSDHEYILATSCCIEKIDVDEDDDDNLTENAFLWPIGPSLK